MNLTEKKQKRYTLVQQAKKILQGADEARREMTVNETRDYDEIMADVGALGREIAGADRKAEIGNLEIEMNKVDHEVDRGAADRFYSTRDGKEVRTHEPGASIPRPDFSIGRLVQSMVRPETRDRLNEDELRAIQTGQDSKGGILIPSEISAAVIEPLRARSVVASLCRSVEMPSNSLDMIGIDSDAESTAKRELQALDEADITFRGVELRGKKLGSYVVVSEEALFASNAAALIEDSLMFSVAKKLDQMLIHGSGAAGEILGLESTPGIFSNAIGGALSWDTVSTEIFDLRGAFVPQPYQAVISTNVTGFIDQCQTASDKLYVQDAMLPQSYRDLQKFESGIIDDGYFVIGNFRRFGAVAYGMNWRIEASNAASTGSRNAFTEGAVVIRIMGTVDAAYLQPSAFQVLSGITSVSDLA